jgi:uncharacterized FlaG/YvyC family protein
MIEEMTGNSQRSQPEEPEPDFLNTRINLSHSKHKNQWLHDFQGHKAQGKNEESQEDCRECKTYYSDKNKERLEKIEQEIQATRKSLSFKIEESFK